MKTYEDMCAELTEANVKKVAAKTYGAAKKSGRLYKKYVLPIIKRVAKVGKKGGGLFMKKIVYPALKKVAKMILTQAGLYDAQSRDMEKLINAMVDEMLMDSQTQAMLSMETIEEVRSVYKN